MRRAAFVLVAVLVFVVLNGMIYYQERAFAEARTVFVALRPADPRSLMQGDYMALRYQIDRDIREGEEVVPYEDGTLVVTLDEADVIRYERPDDGRALAPGELLLNYRYESGSIVIASDSYFFAEGDAELYRDARYAEVLLTDDGRTRLVGLRGGELEPLGPPPGGEGG